MEFSEVEFKDMFGKLDEPFLSFSPTWLSSEDELHVERVELNLFHRPRGSKGLWQIIGPGDKVRVTTGKGKRLKLTVNSEVPLPNSTIDTLSKAIKLHDLSECDEDTKSSAQGGFAIQSIEYMGKNCIEFQLNVEKGGPKLQFGFFLQLSGESPTSSPEPSHAPMHIYEGRSVEFATHNSGGTVAMANQPKRKRTKVTGSSVKHSSSSMEASPEVKEALVVVKSEPLPMMAPSWSDGPSPASSTSDDMPEPNFSGSPSSSILQIPVIEPLNITHLSQVAPVHLANRDENGFDRNNIPDSMFVRYFVPGSLDIQGNVRAKQFSQLSDARLKTNITTISNALQIVSKLKGKRYQWKSSMSSLSGIGKPEAENVIGLIAQEVEKVLPEVVFTDAETGLKSVSYAEILPVLLEAFNEFVGLCQNEEEITALKLRMLQGNLDTLEREVREQMDDQRALQMAIISQTFVDKMCPDKPIILTKKTPVSGWKNNALQAMFYVLQTAFTVGVILGVMWYTKQDSRPTINTFITSAEPKSLMYQGKCLNLFGNSETGWFAFNRCDYTISPLVKCMGATETESLGTLLAQSELTISSSALAKCEQITVLLEDSAYPALTQPPHEFKRGTIHMFWDGNIALYGNSTVGWTAFNQGVESVYPIFKCFGPKCTKTETGTITKDFSDLPLSSGVEREISDSIGCDLCVALIQG